MVVLPTVPVPARVPPLFTNCTARRGDRTVHRQRAAVDRGRAGVAVGAGQRQRTRPPVFTSASPVPPPPPPSAMTPLTVVDRPLPPTVSVRAPSSNRPAPSNQPAAIPNVSIEKSNTPPALAISRALPPLLPP